MSERIKKINEVLRAEIAKAINNIGVLRDGLITVTHVKTSANLKSATILISVLPESLTGTALHELKKANSQINSQIIKRVKLKSIPHFNWKVDNQERYAVEMDKVIDELV